MIGMNSMAARLNYQGGYSQLERMIKQKQRDLQGALKFSYQQADVEKDGYSYRMFIAPDHVTMDKDEKVLYSLLEDEVKIGDIIKWLPSETYWLVYEQELTENAYFKGGIRRCLYEIEWQSGTSTKSIYASIVGPKQSNLSVGSHHGLMITEPNYTLSLLMPSTSDSKEYFKRFSKFYLQDVCWQVVGVDWITNPGLLTVHAKEDYTNRFEDENGLVGVLKPLDVDSNSAVVNATISGDSFIKCKQIASYTYTGTGTGTWTIEEDKPVTSSVSDDGKTITVTWTANYPGSFTITKDSIAKTITVKSLF